MPFPATLLQPRIAEINALVFENPHAGVPLGLYWSFRVEFDPLSYSGEEFHCSLSADWVRIPVRNWRDIAGCTIEGGHDVVDASFYTIAHDLATGTKLRIGGRQGKDFEFDWKSAVDFAGWAGDDEDPDLQVHAKTTARFTGVLVYTPLLEPFPSRREAAERLLAQFVYRPAFGALVNRTNEFGVDEWRLVPE